MRFYVSLLCGISALFLAACSDENANTNNGVQAQQEYKWKLVTSWPKNFPGLGMAPERFAKDVETMSNGRLKIKVFGANELVPGLQVFETVSSGTAQMGHAAAYYWKGKIPAAQFFTAIPFGMNAQEMNAWLHHGGGLELWQELYAPFNLVPMAGGNTGVQLAGWFKKEIKSVDDLKGLKMRIPGLGGEVLKRLGGVPVTLPGGELFTALQTGTIDATEWVGPYNDLAFGFHKAADYYYYSGWHEPGAVMEFTVNKEALEALPEDLQAIVKVAARAINQDMLDEYTARNNDAVLQLKEKHKVAFKPLPQDVMQELKRVSDEVMQEQVVQDETMAKVWASYKGFMDKVRNYHQVSELEYYKNRG